MSVEMKVLEEARGLVVTDKTMQAIVSDLQPVADRLEVYGIEAKKCRVTNKAEADAATALVNQIVADEKLVNDHEKLAWLTDGFHRVHKGLVGLRNAFTGPMSEAKRTIKGKVIAWQEDERRKAEAEQRRLQAIADEQARKERARLEQEASRLKTPEKREARLEQAAMVQPVVVQVEAQKADGLKARRVWVATVTDPAAFMAAAAARPELMGFVTINATGLARAKSANPMFDVSGVTFKQEVR